jgi:anti-sigma factor RsiW
MHELLPWHVNGTLEGEEARIFEGHLRDCPSCGRDLPLLISMREAIERHGEALFRPHPAAEWIVGEVFGQLEAERADEVRSHLSFCPTCAVEARLARQGKDGTPVASPAVRLPGRLKWRIAAPWIAAAAILLAVSLPYWRLSRPARHRTDVLPSYYVESPQRSAEAALVRVPSASAGFQLVLPIDLDPAAYPLRVSISDSAGHVVFSRDDVREIYRESFLFIFCARQDFPDGDYVARVEPAARQGPAELAPLRFRFRVVGE